MADPLPRGWRFLLPLWPVLLIAAIVSVLGAPFLAAGTIPYGSDMLTLNVPLLTWMARALHAGHWPLWNPYSGGGYPLSPFSALIFYPPTWLLAVLPANAAVVLTEMLDVFLAGAGTIALLRWLGGTRWGAALAGVTFAFSGYIAAHLYAGHFLELGVIAWMPWTMLAMHAFIRAPRAAPALGLAFCVAMQVLANGVEFLPFSLYPAIAVGGVQVGVVVARQRWQAVRAIVLGALLAMILVGLLTAVLTLPFADVVRLSVRGNGVSFADATKLSLPVPVLALWLLPDLLGNEGANTWWFGQVHHQYWHEFFAYAGLIPLLASLAMWRLRPLPRGSLTYSALSLGGVVLALGSATPVYSVVFHLVPGLGLVRVPARWLLLTSLGIAVLSGLGLPALCAARPRAGRVLLWALVGTVGVLLVSLLPLFVFNSFGRHGDPNLLTAQAWSTIEGAVVRLIVSVAVLTGLFLLRARAMLSAGGLMALLLLGALADLGLANRPIWQSVQPIDYLHAAAPLPDLQGRLLDLSYSVPLRLGMIDARTRDVQDYAPITLLTYWKATHPTSVAGLLSGHISASGARDLMQSYDAASMRLLGVRIVYTDHPLSWPGLVLTQRLSAAVRWWIPYKGSWNMSTWLAPLYTYVDRAALPPAFLARSVSVVTDRSRAQAVDRQARAAGSTPLLRVTVEGDVAGRIVPTTDLLGYVREWWAATVLARDQRAPTVTTAVSTGVQRVSMGDGSSVVRVQTRQRALLVLDNVFTPGWVATVDGLPTTLRRVSGLLQGVWVPAGVHTVSVVYAPLSLAVGGALSLLGCAVLVLGALGVGVASLWGARAQAAVS